MTETRCQYNNNCQKQNDQTKCGTVLQGNENLADLGKH
jgi:hypothetical protein